MIKTALERIKEEAFHRIRTRDLGRPNLKLSTYLKLSVTQIELNKYEPHVRRQIQGLDPKAMIIDIQ